MNPSGEVIPEQMVQRMRQSKHAFGAVDLHTQIVHSIFDLTIFGAPKAGMPRRAPTEIYKETVNTYSLIPYVPDTFWFAKFTHLCNYGAGYYSYLYCRVFSSALW
jgi:intermediate peptidase